MSISKKIEDPFQDLERIDYKVDEEKVLNTFFCGLTKRQEEIIKQRYFHDMTLEEVGKLHGITRERVRQIEIKAFKRASNRVFKKYGDVYNGRMVT